MPAQNHVALLPDRDGDIHAGWRYPGGRHWEQARRLNRRVNALSGVLMRLSSRQLLRVRAHGSPELHAHDERNSSAPLLLTRIAETAGSVTPPAGLLSDTH